MVAHFTTCLPPGTIAMNQHSLEDDISALEARVEALASLCERLRGENRSLREQQNTLVEERARLVERNDVARHKVEQMIERLKALESSQ